ncbi:YdcF family protein [Pedobacter sp. L105]|uniref:YdcF family protein n=1 Tax=Pedobacter sp. L105 TaxID=1641871 RepID=UPI00131ABC08|nr:YdcF family protein [Pedobacter sp. L105]
MKSITLLLFLFLLSTTGFSQKNLPDRHYHLIRGYSYVQSKNYYLLTLFSELPGLKTMLQHDPVLSKLSADKRADLLAAVKSNTKDFRNCAEKFKFSNEEIIQIGNRLGELYQPANELGKLVGQHLIPSGCYQLYNGQGDKQLLIKAWEQDAKAINHTINVYTEGEKPNYPQIDSIGFNIKERSYPEMVSLNAGLALSETQKDGLFYAPSMFFALQSLEINERNRAGDFEPLAETVNKAALTYAASVKWNHYPYTLILIPGEGPEEKDVELSAGGMLRCRLAALQYHQGMAPFIMVSGGCVHPYKTKYNEAAEMKKFLMQALHIPEYAILMEPHARHTTTNLRNCVRLIYRYGFPMDKPCITSTAKSQSMYISQVMTGRCEKELGYVPYTNGKRLSDTELEFYPLAVSLQIDFDEPMDP